MTQLTYAHARYLDTRTHTFTTVDPLYYQLSSAQLYNPQLMNAYSYANNNPVVNTDPTGLWSISAAYNSVKSAVSSAVSSVKSYVNSAVSSIKSAGSSASSLVSSAATYVASKVNVKSVASAVYAVGAGAVASIANTVIGVSNILAVTNSFSISGAVSNYSSNGSLAPSFTPSLDAGSFGITNPTNVTQFNSAKLGGDIAQIVTPAAVEMMGSKATTLVGRVMSQQELQSMKQGNIVVGGQNTQTYVTLEGASQYKAGVGGSSYVEFNVPSANILSGGKNNEWGIVLGKNPSNYLKMRLKAQGGTYPSTYENLVEFPN